MNKKLLGLGAAAIIALGGIGYALTHKDMSHATWAEIQAYQNEHPTVTVTYSIPIDKDLALKHNSKKVTITRAGQIDTLLELSDYFQSLQLIHLGTLSLTGTQHHALTEAFPNAALEYTTVTILGTDYDVSTQALDLSALTEADARDTAAALRALPALAEIDLNGSSEVSLVPVEAAALLAEAAPNADYTYTFDLFGQTLSTDMETVEYFKADIGDEGLTTIRGILPMMKKLTYLKLDWCGTTDEAMAQLRDDFADRMKVVWRVFLTDEYNALTDTYKIWAQFQLWTENVECLKYCTEVRYIDMGHSYVESCEFVRYMPHLNTLILADTRLKSLEPLRTCKNLTYLEIFTSHVTDLSPLADLPQLEYLNISNIPANDMTALYGLNNLVLLRGTMNPSIPKEQVQEFKRLNPQCDTLVNGWYKSPTESHWRYGPSYEGGPYRPTPRYALLREQIGYDTKDYSRYPTGYVTEEITYESTGIKPPATKTTSE